MRDWGITQWFCHHKVFTSSSDINIYFYFAFRFYVLFLFQVPVMIYPEPGLADQYRIPWWIILIAILAGILLLTLLVCILWKVHTHTHDWHPWQWIFCILIDIWGSHCRSLVPKWPGKTGKIQFSSLSFLSSFPVSLFWFDFVPVWSNIHPLGVFST